MTCLYPQFAARTGYKKGCRCGRCVAAQRAQNRRWRGENVVAEAQRHRRYAQQPGNRTKIMAKRDEITVKQYEALLAGGRAIAGCQRPAESIDHDYSCCPGKKACGRCVRGALCGPHNRGLGCFDDSATALRAAADYLETPLAVAITAAETEES